MISCNRLTEEFQVKRVKRRWISFFKTLPWWGSVFLAGATYFAIKYYLIPISWYTPPGFPFWAHRLSYHLWMAKHYSQYIIPGAFLALALVSFMKSRRPGRLLNRVASSSHHAPLMQMSWQEFEQLIGAYFVRLGYVATLTEGSADGGIDLILTRGNETHFVQCKQWRATRVPVTVVRELYGVICAHGADGGYVVTAGQFTKDATAFAAGRNIELIDGPALLRHIQPQGKPPLGSPPQCPLCGADMASRISRRGPSLGKTFWGCTRFPGCNGLREI